MNVGTVGDMHIVGGPDCLDPRQCRVETDSETCSPSE